MNIHSSEESIGREEILAEIGKVLCISKPIMNCRDCAISYCLSYRLLDCLNISCENVDGKAVYNYIHIFLFVVRYFYLKGIENDFQCQMYDFKCQMIIFIRTFYICIEHISYSSHERRFLQVAKHNIKQVYNQRRANYIKLVLLQINSKSSKIADF